MFKQYLKNYNEIQDSLLLCNDCKKELLKIVSLDFDERINDYIIKYNCSKNKEKEIKEISLKQYLITQNAYHDTTKESSSYCPYHEYIILHYKIYHNTYN